MKKLFIGFTLAALGLICAGTSRAQTIYSWPGDGHAHLDGSYNLATGITLTVPANTTQVNIVNSRNTGCATDIIDTVSVTSGPNPQVGEWIDVSQGFQPGLFQIIAVTPNANGTFDLVENQATCEGFPVHTGSAFLGPGFHYYLTFIGTNWATAQCNSSTSSITAGYLDANGNPQSAASEAGTVTCSNSGGSIVTTTGTFSSTVGTVNFTIVNQNGRYGRYAQSATWTVSSGVAAALYLCGSKRIPCKLRG